MENLKDVDDARARLREVAARIANREIGSEQFWGGADVAIVEERSIASDEAGFYPDPRFVVTPYAHELSWLFYQLRDIFTVLPFYDGQSKIEFFGRLANAALRYQTKCTGNEKLGDLLAAVLHEAFAIADEIEDESFASFAIAFGSEIVDDYIDEAERRGFIGTVETRKFFAELGMEYS
jgi:hypothetical protein